LLIENDYEDTTHNPIRPPFLESCGSACNVWLRFSPTGGGSGYFPFVAQHGYNFFGFCFKQLLFFRFCFERLFFFAIQSAQFADSVADYFDSAAAT
jgi:hypothetical protein